MGRFKLLPPSLVPVLIMDYSARRSCIRHLESYRKLNYFKMPPYLNITYIGHLVSFAVRNALHVLYCCKVCYK